MKPMILVGHNTNTSIKRRATAQYKMCKEKFTEKEIKIAYEWKKSCSTSFLI